MKLWIVVSLMIISLVITSGCFHSDNPNVKLDVNWGGLKGMVPLKSNDMGTADKRTIKVVVENQESYTIEGLSIRVSAIISNFRVSPKSFVVMTLGPKGSSKSDPAVFTLESLGTPPGEYFVYVFVEYDGQVIKERRLDVDIG